MPETLSIKTDPVDDWIPLEIHATTPNSWSLCIRDTKPVTMVATHHPLTGHLSFKGEGDSLETNFCIYDLQETTQNTHEIHVNVGNKLIKCLLRFPWESIVKVSKKETNQDEILKAPINGKVTKSLVKEGTSIQQGETLMILEAMKMENTLKSPITGMVKTLLIKEGDTVTQGQSLCVIKRAEG